MNDHELDLALADFGAHRVQPTAPPVLRQRIRTMPLPTEARRGWLPQSPKWGFTMFSAVKFMAAGVIVALFGGLLVTGVLTTPSEVEPVPAASSPYPDSDPTDGIAYIPTDDPAVFQVISEPHKDRDWLHRRYGRGPVDGALAIGPEGDVWVQGANRAGKIFIAQLGVPGRTESEQCQDLVFSRDGTLWCPGWGGVELRSFDGDAWTEHEASGIVDVFVAADGAVHMLAERGYPEHGELLSIDDTGMTRRMLAPPSDFQDISGSPLVLAVTPDGVVWTAGGCGVFGNISRGWLLRYVDGTPELVQPSADVADPCVMDLAVGPEGGLWASVNAESGSSLIHYDGKAWTIHPNEKGWKSWGPMEVGLDGRVWHAVRDWGEGGPLGNPSGPVVFDGQSFTRYLQGTRISDLAIGPDESVWTTNNEGVYVITPEAVAATE